MSLSAASETRTRRPGVRALGIAAPAVAFGVLALLLGPQALKTASQAQFHGPDLNLFLKQSLVVQIHILAALGTVVVGGILLSARKGRLFHRTGGWTWAVLMAITAGSSLFIMGLNGDHWSFIHLLSGWTLIVLPLALVAARRHNVQAHKRSMTSLYWGASIAAGLFTFIPGRLMWRLFFG